MSARVIASGVHQSAIHDSAARHVQGSALYIDDLKEPEGLLHGWVILADRAHARILTLDLSGVAAAEGVVCVMTARDIPGLNDAGPIMKGEVLLADQIVEHEGQAIAIIAARSFAQARDAAKLVRVTYEDLPAYLTIEAALQAERFVVAPLHMQRGDAARAIAEAPHCLSGETSAGGQDHFYLETQIAVATPQENGEMHIFSSTQHPTEVQHIAARLLARPYAAITVEVRRMGGAFGGKESHASLIAGMAALLAARCGEPVKLRLPRDVDMLLTGKRHDTLARFSVGFDDAGRILGLDMMIALRAGHVADLSGPVLTRALCHVDNVYWLPNVKVSGYACKTNTVSNTAFRGFGGPQGMFAIEAVIVRIAARLGLSSEAVRQINHYAPGQDTTPYGQSIGENNTPRLLAELKTAADITARRGEIAQFNASHPYIKKALVTYAVKFGISFNLPSLNQAGALLHVYTDGSVHLNHGGTEMGQGLYVKVAQIVASCFQIEREHVHISSTRTDKIPNTSATAASSGSDINGMAAKAAADIIKSRMAAIAAAKFGGAADDVVFSGGYVYLGNRSISFPDLAQLCWAERVSLSATGYYRTPDIHFDQASMTGSPFYYFSYGACATEAAIDMLTGENRILRVDIIHDTGASLNPAVDIGQIEGGFVQGQGWMTMEELVWDQAGRLRTHAPSTYKIPTSRDVPPIFNTHLLADAPNAKPTIFRSKAIGEPPFTLAISCFLAIQEAVAAAVGWPAALTLCAPATPEAILRALGGSKEGSAFCEQKAAKKLF
jgi:xanthine dehydrogenase large subunit